MAQKCYNCSADLDTESGSEIVICEYCHHKNKIDTEKDSFSEELQKASERRNEGSFEEAEKNYIGLLIKNKGDYRAIWGKLLCKYGVVYIERDNEDRILTCRKTPDTEFLQEQDYKVVLELASGSEREQFQKDAKIISAIQSNIRKLKDISYDIFICYKESEDGKKGLATSDSFEAEILYNELCYSGYKVFFAKETLKNKAGADYEAEIYNAIETSRVMLVMGSKTKYFTSTWIQSEWSRFLETMKKNSEKVLIPMVKNISFYDLPKEIQKQGINFGIDSNNRYAQLKERLRKIFEVENMMRLSDEILAENPSARDAVYMIRNGQTEEEKEKGITKLRETAKKESAEAWFLLGCVLFEDQEDTKAVQEAFKWFKKAAKAGYPDARFQVGFMYEYGIGTKKNKTEAESFYRGLNKKDYPIPN